MKRNFEIKSLKSVLNNLIDKNSLNDGLNNVKIQSLWKKTMGGNVNSYTTDIYLKKKTLYVSLSSSVLRQELSYGKQKIVDLINEEIGNNLINKIVFQTNLSEKKTVDIKINDPQKKKNKIKRCNCFVKVKLRS